MGGGEIIIKAEIHGVVSAESAAFENYVETESVEFFSEPRLIDFFELRGKKHIHRGVLYADYETDDFGEIANRKSGRIDDFWEPFVEVVEGFLLRF